MEYIKIFFLKDKSLKTKIIRYFFIIFISISIIFIIFFYNIMKYFYYSSIEGVLSTKANYSSELFSSYFSDYNLIDIIMEDKDQFYKNIDSNSKIQILDNSGSIIFDNTEDIDLEEKNNYKDIEDAKIGKESSYIYKNKKNEKVLSVSVALKNKTDQVGILRVTTSLRDIDKIIANIIRLTFIFAIFLGILTLFVIIIITDNIIKPIEDLTNVAKKFEEGNFYKKADEKVVDEIATLSKTLNTMALSILKKEEVKNEFISSISHELRTPLTVIKGWAITLEQAIGDRELLYEGLDLIGKESDRLAQMVEELLDFSSLSLGKMDINKENTNIVKIASLTNKQILFRANNKNIDMIVNYSNPNIFINIDKNRIKQVFLNLLDNAIKFTKEGGTIITDIKDYIDFVRVDIIDTGIGISSQEIEFVTDKFYKGKTGDSQTGLGLSICEEIIKLHGGQLQIESILSQGTKVSFIIPKGNDNNEI